MEYNTLLGINVLLVCLCLSAIVVIIVMIVQNSTLNEEMNKELKEIEKKCPDCKCPKNPDCNVNCPDCNCPEYPELNEDNNNNSTPQDNIKYPKCPKCPKCPSVDDIVSGIFPGRNPEVIEGGRYFQVDASNNYDGLSTSNFYEQNYKFPMDKILKPDLPRMNSYNIDDNNQINNSINNEYVDTNKSRELPVNSDIEDTPTGEIEETESSPSMDGNYYDSFYQKILPDNFI